MSDGRPAGLSLMRAAGGDLLAGSRSQITDWHEPGEGEAFNVESWTLTAEMLGPASPELDGSAALCNWIHTSFGPRTHAHLHSTPTYDVDVILDGEVDLLLETTHVTLRSGDVVVIPGVVHGWRTNESPCWFICTMYPLHPVTAR